MSEHERTWEAYAEGQEFSWAFAVSDQDMLTYGNLIGDFNPIHADKDFAIAKGFDGPLVYGMLLSGQMSRLIGQELPDKHAILTGVSIDFLQPSYAGDALRFDAKLVIKSDSSRALEFKCRISRGGKSLCKGNVMAVWRP